MQWVHNASFDWMKERAKYLTASEIESIIPRTATGRKRDTRDALMAIYAKRHSELQPGCEVSTGAAARGHIMEPYAIDAFNRWVEVKGITSIFGVGIEKVHHWDDVVITNGIIGFSPDGLDITQESAMDLFGSSSTEISYALAPARIMAEVKSYSAEKHYKAFQTGKFDLKERWQIAHAMVVNPFIELAVLIFFNPSVNLPMFFRAYTRLDLHTEMEDIKDAVKDYMEWEDFINQRVAACQTSGIGTMTEMEIYTKEMEPKLNPVS